MNNQITRQRTHRPTMDRTNTRPTTRVIGEATKLPLSTDLSLQHLGLLQLDCCKRRCVEVSLSYSLSSFCVYHSKEITIWAAKVCIGSNANDSSLRFQSIFRFSDSVCTFERWPALGPTESSTNYFACISIPNQSLISFSRAFRGGHSPIRYRNLLGLYEELVLLKLSHHPSLWIYPCYIPRHSCISGFS